MDFDVPRSSRKCSKTERELSPGESFYSAIFEDGDDVVRHDFARDAWEGPPEDAVAWWKSKVPAPSENRMQWAPNDVMLQLFDRLEDEPTKHDMRYVLALLLVRRRVMRDEGVVRNAQGVEVMQLYCPRRDAMCEVAVVTPSNERISAIQDELAELLFSSSL